MSYVEKFNSSGLSLSHDSSFVEIIDNQGNSSSSESSGDAVLITDLPKRVRAAINLYLARNFI